MDPNEQEVEFRVFVLRLAEDLSDTETNKLVYICKLPTEYKDRQPLVVLESMHNMGLFSATKLDSLARLLKEIKRDDLSKAVEKYSKQTAKKTRKAGAKSRATSLEPTEANLSLTTSSQATFEVFNIQSKITRDVMDQMMKLQRQSELGLGIRQRALDDLERLVKRAQELQQQLKAQPNPKELQGGAEDSGIYSWPDDTGDDSSTPEYTYIDPPAVVAQPRRAATLPSAQLVTGRAPTKERKPPTLPKPNKPRTEGDAAHSGGSPRVAPPSVPRKPAIALSDLQRKKSTLRSAQQPPERRSLCSSRDSSSFTGDSYTATGSEDSGFGDAKSFLKVDIGRGQRKLYYKRLETPDEVDSYTNITREGTDPQDNIYELPVEVTKGAIYQNVARSRDGIEYMNTNH